VRGSRLRRLDLLHEDRHIVVVNKPAGLLTIPSAPGLGDREDTLLGRAREYARHKQGRRAYAGMLHRLDRETSGALAIALSREAHRRGRDLFRDHRFERRYLALVAGVPPRQAGTIRARISSDYRDGRRAAVRASQPGRDAVTHYAIVKAFGAAALVDLSLETGRQHQIAAGRPRVPRIMLHAWKLAFPHPITGARIEVTAEPPNDFRRALELLAID
jgi:23S rRNA pseudouridine1911/1915/1917 synthase